MQSQRPTAGSFQPARTPAESYASYDELEFQKFLISDLKSAQNFVIMQSAFVSQRGVNRYLPIIHDKLAAGVRVCTFVQEPEHWRRRHHPDLPREIATRLKYFEDVITSLMRTGAHVNVCVKVHEKFAVIDERIVWQGSLNFLSHRDTFECPSRWESRFRVIEAIAKYRLDTCTSCWKQLYSNISNDTDARLQVRNLARILSEQRQRGALSQEELAKRIGVDQTLISRLERGENINSTTLVRIADALGLELVPVPRLLRYAVEHLVAQRLSDT